MEAPAVVVQVRRGMVMLRRREAETATAEMKVPAAAVEVPLCVIGMEPGPSQLQGAPEAVRGGPLEVLEPGQPCEVGGVLGQLGLQLLQRAEFPVKFRYK